MRSLTLTFALVFGCLAAPSAFAQTYFSEDFSDNSAGWTLGPEWQIGPTLTSPPATLNPDPALDHTPTADNGVGGTIIGGNISTGLHSYYFMESPAVDLSGAAGTVLLTFWRWLNLDYAPYMVGSVQVFNGVSWVTLYQTGGSPEADNAWAFYQYDVTAYKNANFRVRFGHTVTSTGALTVSGWNVDDLEIAAACADDADGDTYVSVACGGNDCNDNDPMIHPGATEQCNGLDDDCDGQIDQGFPMAPWYRDQDGDGYGNSFDGVLACAAPPGYVAVAGDCDDLDAAVHPGATEVCNNVDDNCDGQLNEGFPHYWRDADGDGYGDPFSTPVCTPTAGYVADSTDCVDADAGINPGAAEICNGIDDDCDGLIDDGVSTIYYYDGDGDGYGLSWWITYVCTGDDPPPGYVTTPGDCMDGDPQVHPGAPELCNGMDDDCDGEVDEDCNYLTFEFIRDVGNDQGRNVRLRWIRSAGDSVGALNVSSYSVWRRADDGAAAQSRGAGAGPGARRDAARPGDPEALALPPGTWDFIAWVPAVQEQRYQLVSPTLCDSNSAGLCWSVFFVRAHYTFGGFVDSPLDSGYSVDNIVPGVPQSLVATATPGGNALDWSDATDPDFQYFRVYRGTGTTFVPGPGNLVHSTATSGWTDPAGGVFVYKVTTVDANGNESEPATAAITVSVGEDGAGPLAFASIAPNPFRRGLACTIVVPRGGAMVELRVHDLAGRVVRTLVSSRLGAGRHTLEWNGRDESGRRAAPGIYLLRLTGDGTTSVRRVAFTP